MNTEQPQAKKRRTLVRAGCERTTLDPLPPEFRHIRTSPQNVKKEYYAVVDHLKSKYHLTQRQAVAAVIVTANKLFQRQWKFYCEDSTKIDYDTAPHDANNQREGQITELLALSLIVREIMEAPSHSTVTYQDDGSRKQGIGAYSVQGININGTYRSLPTLAIASETRQNLKDLKITVMSMLSVVGGVPIETLYQKIDFVMTDSTAHNLGVEALISEELGVEYRPSHLLCHAHPVMMFVRKLEEECKDVEATIGTDKLFAAFSVPFSNTNDSVTNQFVDIVHRFGQTLEKDVKNYWLLVPPLCRKCPRSSDTAG